LYIVIYVTVTEVAILKFYGRKNEIKELEILFKQSKNNAKMSVITGRRRIGKTLLSLSIAKRHKYIYLFVAKKSEKLLCIEYLEEIKSNFDIPIVGEIVTFKEIFNLLLEISKNTHFTLIIDEFQEFYNINPSIYSEMQHLWDINKNECKINIILIGSIYSLMSKIFQDSKEPLFGRAERIIYLKPFKISTMKNILSDYNIFNNKVLFDYYIFTGGIPKYIDLLVANKAFKHNKIVDFILSENSPFINEGKNLLIEEFGKEYSTYFSILELISLGRTRRSEIESILEKTIGGHLNRLEKDYRVISKYKPVLTKQNTRLQKYRIADKFLEFWFRFIYRNYSAIESGNYNYVKEIFKRDYLTYSGKLLEDFFLDLFAETSKYNIIGPYWERGNQNEIDFFAINEMKKTVKIADIKLNKSKININVLKRKSKRIISQLSDYKIEWIGLSIEDTNIIMK
jgi:AAA+ ATPase superfamily predicted ATPase